MEAKQRIIFDEGAYSGEEGVEVATTALIDAGRGTDKEIAGEYSEDHLLAYASSIMELDLEEELTSLARFLDHSDANPNRGNYLIARGTAHCWDGTTNGITLHRTLDGLLTGYESIIRDCLIGKIWDENGSLFIHGHHHDGAADVEVRQLTTDGVKVCSTLDGDGDIQDPITLLDSHGSPAFQTFDPGDEAKLFDEMWSNPIYTSRPRYMELAFGCPREEWDLPYELRVIPATNGETNHGLFLYAGSAASYERYADLKAMEGSGPEATYSITLAGIDFANEDDNRYACKGELEGLAASWSSGTMSANEALASTAFRDFAVQHIADRQEAERFEVPRHGLDLKSAMREIASHLEIPIARMETIVQEAGLAEGKTRLEAFGEGKRIAASTENQERERVAPVRADEENQR